MIRVPLSKGFFTLIDEQDAPRVQAHSWAVKIDRRKDGTIRAAYGIGWVKGKRMMLHRFILEVENGLQVDHINGDGLDNRRENLRLATRMQNSRNVRRRRDSKTGVKGVCFDKARGKFQAGISISGRWWQIGRFENLEDAVAARRMIAYLVYGDFAGN